MHKPGHFGLSLLATSLLVLIVVDLGYPHWGILIAAAGTAGGNLPDIDNKPLVPFSHHGWTHTVLFTLIAGVAIVPLALAGYWSILQFGQGIPVAVPAPSQLEFLGLSVILYIAAVLGGLSHLFGDTLSTAGGKLLIRPWKPISNNYVRIGITTADSPVYNTGFFIAGVISHGIVYQSFFGLI
ncbi:metal-dependent hydrolase [Haloarcula marismortui]|jgi:inner membrane protein|uniref:Membrane-bound metal-dependent hydrolase n=1 Tax=Haloarcula marismortui ATCC 33799 TaxID=662475 RepID=M0KAU6_9EURY|nr:metal-dependent hydrolase [Haloarcula californiae]EMA17299.1 membrane-bound metal-dependent hydrolase [Haloarcula californiae ATCC 33799]